MAKGSFIQSRHVEVCAAEVRTGKVCAAKVRVTEIYGVRVVEVYMGEEGCRVITKAMKVKAEARALCYSDGSQGEGPRNSSTSGASRHSS
jgi:hypothetical protein